MKAKFALLVISWFSLFRSGHTTPNKNTKNVALGKSCNMSSKYSNYDCGNAVNGNTDGVYKDNNCIHTGIDDRTPWWEVYLGRPYPVMGITVWAREGAELSRMPGCVIYVDNKKCYEYSSSDTNRKKEIKCTSSVMNGSTVRVEKKSRDARDINYYINICEVDVTSCEDEYWGNTCDARCGNCLESTVCDKLSGHCSCKPGFEPPLCTKACVNGTYGQNCSYNCSKNCNDECDKEFGNCTCKPGWKDALCEQECDNGTYGQSCAHNCSENCAPVCDKINGQCTCNAEWIPPLCVQECDNGTYGQSCALNCSENCAPVCDKVNGHCTCKAGWKPPLCVQGQGSSEPANVGLILGSIGGGVAILLVVVIILLLIRKRAGCSVKMDTTLSGGPLNKQAALIFNNSLYHLNDLNMDSPERQTHDSLAQTPTPSPEHNFYDSIAVCHAKQSCTSPRVKEERSSDTLVRHEIAASNDHHALSVENVYSNESLYTNAQSSNGTLDPVTYGNAQSSNGTLDPVTYGNVQSSVENLEEVTYMDAQSLMGTLDPVTLIGAQSSKEVLDPVTYGNVRSSMETLDPSTRENTLSLKGSLDPVESMLVNALMTENFHEDFKTLPAGLKKEHNVGHQKENISKNRFHTIIPYDNNRVVLHGPHRPDSNSYINASYIRGYHKKHSYIAAQGPMENTVDDFWKMVWQEGVTHIVMLTNVIENDKTKCEVYWPFVGALQRYGDVIVTVSLVLARAHYVIRNMEVRSTNTQTCRHVTQYQYMSWVDNSITTTTPLVDFWRTVRSSHRQGCQHPSTPLLVHCSAGVGRTGTYIALDIAMDQAEQESRLDIQAIIQQARDDRCDMLYTRAQYIFLHETVLEAYSGRHARFDSSAFASVFPNPIEVYTANDIIDAEFEKLHQLKKLFPKHTYQESSKKKNAAKNRSHNFLPNDKHLVRLTRPVQDRNDYINAVFLSTFMEQLGCIITQLPLPDTVLDLWRLVNGDNITTIVSLGPSTDESKERTCFWPRTKDDVIIIGPYSIVLTFKSDVNDSVKRYNVSLKHEAENFSRQLYVFHYENWTDILPESTPHLLQMIEAIQEDCESPILVQCLDGTTKSGLFCAVCDVINRLVADHVIDIYITVRNVQAAREHSFTSLVQYRYLYHVIQEYLRQNKHTSTFDVKSP